MTKDEALKKMQAVKSYMTSGNPIWSVTEMGEAFDMAIEALSAQPEHSEGLYVDGYNNGYRDGWKEGREALRREIWEDGRDRLD